MFKDIVSIYIGGISPFDEGFLRVDNIFTNKIFLIKLDKNKKKFRGGSLTKSQLVDLRNFLDLVIKMDDEINKSKSPA